MQKNDQNRIRTRGKNNKGITLIALIITIIVLLILAGVSIATLTGDRGILNQASDAKINTQIGQEKEKVKLSATGALAKNKGGGITEENLAAELTNYIGARDVAYKLMGRGPFIVKYLDTGRNYLIDENGNVSKYDGDISEILIKVGDYVSYDPTVKDKSGTPVEASKLTYTSPTGSGTEHGNGYTSTEEGGGQKFTATASAKWRVLDVENGIVTLISADVIKKDETSQDSGNFVMNGAPGYLYAERELNEVCKIYGYGYGADTSQVTTYTYGGPLDGELTGEITGSGARSITIEDINKKAGITEADYTTLFENYGDKNLIEEVYYPTITTSNGQSSSAGAGNLEFTDYYYGNEEIENLDAQNMLFNKNYWLASRSILAWGQWATFNVRHVVVGDGYAFTGGYYVFDVTSSSFSEYAGSDAAVRPVVTLKSNIIDIDAGYDETTAGWSLK